VRRALPFIPALLALVGLGCLVAAAFAFAPVVGIAALGVALIVVAATLNGR
jgi:hypothetical protein